MDGIWSLLDEGGSPTTLLVRVVTLALILVASDRLGLATITSVALGRWKVNRLKSMPRDASKVDATVSGIFVYPGKCIHM